jgi:hypothetical protein
MPRSRKPTENRVTAAIKRVGVLRLALVLVLVLAGGYLAFALSVAGVARSRQPALALQFAPREAEALSKQADLYFATNPQHPPQAVGALATRSLRAQAINPRALRLLGYVENARGDRPHAQALMGLAARLSRRESGAQLWLINRAALDGNLPLAVQHIDVLLRTSPNTQSKLYPILLQGLIDPGFRRLLRTYLRSGDSPWASDFVTYAIANTADLSPVQSLFEEGEPTARTGFTVEQSRMLMERLMKAGRYGALQRIYLLTPGSSAWRLRDPRYDLSDIEEKFGVAGWQAFNLTDAGASFVGKGKNAAPAMTLYADPSTTRIVASKLLYLEPGSYALSTGIADLDAGAGGGLTWQLRCPTRVAGSIVWSGVLISQQSAHKVTVPEDCRVQFLDLVAAGGQGQTGLDATILRVSLAPLGPTADS